MDASLWMMDTLLFFTWHDKMCSFKFNILFHFHPSIPGSILAPHVDRMPLVTSCILNIAQEGLEEPWPLEVYDHNGNAHNVTMEPGDMVS